MTVENYLEHLRLLQLADTALPIGATAHSFGLETLVAEGLLSVANLSNFLQDYLTEVGRQEALFCRAAFRLSCISKQAEFERAWLDLNMRFSALKPARESRKASAMLGKRLLQLVLALEEAARLESALEAALQNQVDAHHLIAFGLVGGVLNIDEELTVLAYLQQSVAGLVAACQKLMPLGQRQATRLQWTLKPILLDVAQQSQSAEVEETASYLFAHGLDMAAMRHPQLATRLFISQGLSSFMLTNQVVPRVEAGLDLRFHYVERTGQTHLKVMQQTPPLRVVRAFGEKDGPALAHLHNVSGGVLGGDALVLTASVGPGAQAQLTTPGATRIYKHRPGYPTTSQRTCFTVEANGLLEYLPDPLIPFAQSRYRQETTVHLAAGAGLFWWEIVAPGREAADELFAYDSLDMTVDIRAGQRPLAIERLRLQPQCQPPDALVRLGPYRYFATFYICRAAVVPEQDWLTLEETLAALGQQFSCAGQEVWGVSTLPQDGVVVRTLSKTGQGLQDKLVAFWRAAKAQLYGLPIILPRKLY